MQKQFNILKLRQNDQLEHPFKFDLIMMEHFIEPIESNRLFNFDQKLKESLDFNSKDED